MKKESFNHFIARKLLKLDFFGERPVLKILGQGTYQTLHGLIVSLLVITGTTIFAVKKANILLSLGATYVKEYIEPGLLDFE